MTNQRLGLCRDSMATPTVLRTAFLRLSSFSVEDGEGGMRPGPPLLRRRPLFRQTLRQAAVRGPDSVRQVGELREVLFALLHLAAPEVGVVAEQAREVRVPDDQTVQHELGALGQDA